jgi:hypothetical protein
MVHMAWNATSHTLDEGITRVMAAGELPLPSAGYSMRGDDGYDSNGGGNYYYTVTMQVCLDAQEEGSGMTFPAAQPRARLVFTSLGLDHGQPPSRADVADILGPRAVWSSEHDAAGAGGATD